MQDELRDLIEGRAVLLLTNAAARDPDGTTALERVVRADPARMTLLTPEHGFRADLPPGEADPAEGSRIPYYVRHGQPEPELPAGEVYVFDLPLVGARYFTYLDALVRLQAAAAAQGRPLTVLDRANPLGTEVEGPGLDPACASEVSRLPVPIRYGLTAGEVARWWAARQGYPEPRVFPPSPADAEGGFVPPSPNLVRPEAVWLYPATCLLEGTQVSEGRGTEAPFQVLGAPGFDADLFVAGFEAPAWLEVEACAFTPTTSKFAGQPCQGVRLSPRARPRGVLTFGVQLLHAIGQCLDQPLRFSSGPSGRPFLDLLWGSPSLREALEAGRDPTPVAAGEGPPEGFDAARLYPVEAATGA